MTAATFSRIVALGAITGVRTMSGPLALSLSAPGNVKSAMAVMATGEMVADKTPFIGNRTDALPLAGRAATGALVGAIAARRSHVSMPLGALIGAAAAVTTAHLAFRIRTRLPTSNVLGGMLEDAVVLTAAALYARGQSGNSGQYRAGGEPPAALV